MLLSINAQLRMVLNMSVGHKMALLGVPLSLVVHSTVAKCISIRTCEGRKITESVILDDNVAKKPNYDLRFSAERSYQLHHLISVTRCVHKSCSTIQCQVV